VLDIFIETSYIGIMKNTEKQMIYVEIWPKGYADFGGTVMVHLPAGCNDADIQNAVRSVSPWATLSSVRRPQKVDAFLAGLTPAQLDDYANAFRGDNS
jgi:hypothetical protein